MDNPRVEPNSTHTGDSGTQFFEVESVRDHFKGQAILLVCVNGPLSAKVNPVD